MADTQFATNGRASRFAVPGKPSTEEMGTTGLRVSGGRIDEEYDRAWKQGRKARTIQEMLSDPLISRSLWTFELLIRNTSWEFQASDESNEAMLAKEFADQVLFEDQSHSWGESLSNHMSMLSWGWAYHELVWKRRLGYRNVREPGMNSKFTDGRWGLRKTAYRGQDTLWEWMITPEGDIEGMKQLDTYAVPSRGPVTLPLEQCLLFRLSAHRSSPEGRSLFRSAYIPWYHKKNIAMLQGIGIERDLAGLPVIYVPVEILRPNPSPDALYLRQEFERMGRNLKRDEQAFAMLPSQRDEHGELMYDLKLLSSAGTRQVDTKSVLEFYNQEMLIALMTDVVLIGHESVGSLALHSSTTQLLSYGLGGVMDSICEVYNRHFMPRLWAHNGLPPETMPMLTHGDVETVDLDELGNFVVRMAQGGFDLSDVENEVRRRAGLPMREVDDMEEEDEDEPEMGPNTETEDDEDEADVLEGAE